MVLGGVVLALVAIGVAYGLTSQNGSDVPVQRGAALTEHPATVQAAAVAVVPPSAPAVEAPAVATPVHAGVAPVEKVNPAVEKVNTAPGAIAPSEATEITRAAAPRAGKGSKGRKGATAAAANASPPAAAPAAGPSPGAAAIAAVMAAEGSPAAAPPPPAAPAAAAPAPAAPAAPEPTGLVGAIKKAVGPTEPAPAPEKAEVTKAAPVRGDIPELPAQGAISGALGSPRTAARNCIVGQEAPSRATIVFASSGSVQSVSVTGPAAGTPAEACIKTAMSKTVVGPFKHPTFSVSTTISPP